MTAPRLAFASAATSLLVGGLVLAGWVFDSPLLAAWDSESMTLKANAALCFMLYGAALLLLQLPGRRSARAARICTVILGGIAFLTLAEYVTAWDIGIDGIFTRDFGRNPAGTHPRMGPYTAVCFALTTAALWLMSQPGRSAKRPTILAWLGSLVMVIGLYVGLGYMDWFTVGGGWRNLTRTGVYMTPVFMLAGGAWLAVAWRASGERWLIERWITVGFVIGLALLVVVAAFSHLSTKYLVDAGERVNHSHEIFARISQLRSSIDDHQGRLRDWVVAGRADVLRRAEQAPPELLQQQRKLRDLTADHAGQRQRVRRLENLIGGWQGLVDETIRSRTNLASAGTMADDAGGEVAAALKAIHEGLRELEEEERKLLVDRMEHSWSVSDRTFALLPLGTVLSLVLLATGMFRHNHVIAARQRGDEALLRSGRQLRLALEAAEIGEWELDLVSHTMHRSPRFDQVFGYSGTPPPPGWSYELFLKQVHPEDRPRVDRVWKDSLMAGGDWAFECRIVRQDGAAGWIWARGTAVKNEAGQVVEMLGMIRDITDRKQAEELVARQAAELGLLYATAPVGLFFFDTDLRFIRVNRELAELNGVPAEQHIGRTMRELFSAALSDVVEPLLRQVIETGRPIVEYEVRGATIAGSDEPARHWLVSYHPVQAEDGTIRGVHGVLVEITHRKQAEEAVRESEEFVRSVLDSLPAHIVVLDDQGLVIAVNEPWRRYAEENNAALETVGPGASYLKACQRAVDQGDRYAREALAGLRAVLDGSREGYMMEYPCHAPKQERWFLMHIQRVFHGSGGAIISHLDISPSKHVEKALHQSEAGERARRQELEAVMDALPVAIIIARDASTLRMTANRAAEELLRLPRGRNPSQAGSEAGRPDFQVWADGRRLKQEELPMQRATATGIAVDGEEIEVVFPDGERKSLICNAFPLFDESGAVRGCIGAFVDITVRKRRELNVAFLAEMQTLLASISRPAEIMELTGRRIAEHLQLDHCLFVEIDEESDQATVLHDNHAANQHRLPAVYRLADFHTEHEMQAMRAGRMMVIDDVRHFPRPAASSERFRELGIGSLANASSVADGRWKFVLCAIRDQPGKWSAEDTGLLADLVERIHLQLERARAEERLSESEARFRSIFNDASVPMEVSLPDGRFAQVNRAFCELLGYSESELLATTFKAVTYPEDRESLAQEPFLNLLDGAMTSFRAEKRYLRKDGEVVWVDLSVTVVHGADDAPAYCIGQIQDITGRKRAEESLGKSENMLALAVEAGQLGIWNWDHVTGTLHWSERCNEMTGLPRGSQINRAVAFATIHPEERPRIQTEARDALEAKIDMELEFRTVWPDATLRWLQVRGRGFYDESGELVRITGIMQDVTERRESEDALRRFNTQLESLVDKRTEVIKMTMKELQREFAERRRLEEEILEIGERAQARIGQDLHDDLGQQLVGMTILMGLLSSQLAGESHPRAAEAAKLQTFLTGIITTTRNLAKSLYPVELERGGLKLSLQELANRTELLGAVTCKVIADEGFRFEKATEIHLYRIVQESISNALKHGKARNIAIRCTMRSGLSTLTVSDDGSGFKPPEEEGKWAGIGLHLFQYRARLMGARLTVTRGENGGCEVKCSIGAPEAAGKQSLQT